MTAQLKALFRNPFAAIIACGGFLTLVALFLTYREVGKNQADVFIWESNQSREGVVEALHSASEAVDGLVALYAATQSAVDSDSFRIFGESKLSSNRSIHFVSYSRWVTKDGRPEFERDMHTKGYPGFTIHTENDQADAFLTTIYYEPFLPKTASYLGRDLLHAERYTAAIKSAIDNGSNVALGPMTFEDGTEGIELIRAVYPGKRLPSTVEQRRASVLGLIRVGVASEALFARQLNFPGMVAGLRLPSDGDVAPVEMTGKAAEQTSWLPVRNQLQTKDTAKIAGLNFEIPIHKTLHWTWSMLGTMFLIGASGIGMTLWSCEQLRSYFKRQRDERDQQALVVELSKDAEVTQAVQKLTLPKTTHLDSENFKIEAFWEPAAKSGGDWWWMEQSDSERVDLFVGDVTGHGAGPAMVASLVAGCVQGAYRVDAQKSQIPETLQAVNSVLRSLEGNPYWMTMLGVQFDLKQKTLHWWNAGAPLFLMSRMPELEIIKLEGTPLGAGELSLATGNANLQHGDRLLFFTDGAFEHFSEQGKFVNGLRILRKLFRETAEMDFASAHSAILSGIRGMRGPGGQSSDDVTVLLVEV